MEMKLGTETVKDILNIYYVGKLMDCESTAKIVKEKYGMSISDDTILRLAEKYGVKRTKAEAISLSRCYLPRKTIITKSILQILDGMVLGDGSITVNSDTKIGRFKIGSVHEEFARHCYNLFSSYKASEPYFYAGIKGKGMWDVQTLHHPDLYEQYLRWYPNGTKIIPSDIEFTSEMVLYWYLGDGSISAPREGNGRYMYFATNCFSKESLERIVVPKFAEIGIEVVRVTDDSRVFIQTNSINKLLQYMGGRSPVKCFDYKFDIEEWRTFKSMKQASVEANIDYGRLSNWVKQGYIEHSRSPGGKKVVFNSEQFDKLVKRLNSGELPRTPGKKRPLDFV